MNISQFSEEAGLASVLCVSSKGSWKGVRGLRLSGKHGGKVHTRLCSLGCYSHCLMPDSLKAEKATKGRLYCLIRDQMKAKIFAIRLSVPPFTLHIHMHLCAPANVCVFNTWSTVQKASSTLQWQNSHLGLV